MWHKKQIWSTIINVGVLVSIVAGVVTIIAFSFREIRRSQESQKEDSQFESITNAIGEVARMTKSAGANHTQSRTLETEGSPIVPSQLWSATVNVLGMRNTITFEPSDSNVGIPRTIGGTKVCRVIAVPKTCRLNIQLSGTRNKIIIDERLRGRVSVSGKGTKCSVEWKPIDN